MASMISNSKTAEEKPIREPLRVVAHYIWEASNANDVPAYSVTAITRQPQVANPS